MIATTTESIWQTVGPFFHSALPWKDGGVLAKAGARGQRIRLVCTVTDGGGYAVSDGMIEIWQADAGGKYAHPDDTQHGEADPCFEGFGRMVADASGRFLFDTVLPGPVPGSGNAVQAPHINVSIFARGLVRRLSTRVYFAGNELNDTDQVLNLVEPGRRSTLMAVPQQDGPQWHWSVSLQGNNETVFFEV